MATGPLVSIVTPTLNRAPLLRATVDSLRSQTRQDFEHIVVDGASTDGTIDFLQSVASSYPLSWISEPDGGMYEAINKGLAQARGEILAYLNSDDLYFPWTLDVVVQAFDRHPEIDFVYGDALGIEDDTGVRRLYWQFPFHRDSICRTGFLAQPTVFWRRRAFESLGQFDTSLRFVADCDYWMRASEEHRFLKLNEVLAVERDHAATLRTTATEALERELEDVRSRYVDLQGFGHRWRAVRNVQREQLYRRFYSLALLLQSRLPARARFWAWRRFIGADELSLDASEVITQLLPRHGASLEGAMPPSRRWLEPEG